MIISFFTAFNVARLSFFINTYFAPVVRGNMSIKFNLTSGGGRMDVIKEQFETKSNRKYKHIDNLLFFSNYICVYGYRPNFVQN